jgi:hypothetical protein
VSNGLNVGGLKVIDGTGHWVGPPIAGTLSLWIRKTSNYTANNGDLIIADTTNTSFTITLPSGPSLGNSAVTITDGGNWSNNSLTMSVVLLYI